MDRTNRQILINPHTSGTTAPKGLLNLGEIAVQHDSTSGASLWIETDANSNSESTLVRFMNASAVTALVESARTDLQTEIDAINDAVDELSGAVESFSAATVAEFNSAFTAIQAMDKTADPVAGQVVTTIAQEDGKVTETKANVKDLQLGGYSKDTGATGDITGTDTINAALSKLENKVGANKITNADGSIVVTEPTGTATTTDVKVNIKTGEKVIKLDGENGGLYTNLNLVKITESLPATVKERYEFRDSDNNKIGESIDIAKDSHIVSITYDEATQKLIYEYIDASGTTQTTEIDMSNLIIETEVENGIQSVDGKLSIKLDTTGDDTGDGKFLTVGANGLKLDGVTDAINAAIDALDVTDAAEAGKYVSAVNETDGKVSMTRANVSDAVLNGYAKGEKPASTAVVATDDVKGAIAKLEHQIDDAKAAATTKVVEGTDAGNNMTITPSTSPTDGSVTYTIDLVDVASKAALDAEIAARKAVDGQTGQTYAANTGATYISGANDLNDADVKLDAALKSLADRVSGLDYTDTVVAGQYVTKVDETDGLISVARANVSEAVLNNYSKSTDASAVAAADTINQAISKLENQIDVEAAARKAVDGQDGQTYAANTSAKYISGATSLNDADVKLDTAVAALAGSAVTEAGFAAVANKDTTEFGSNAGINVVNAENGGKKIVLDLSLLKIDCGEY